jgi:hypothetical protein
VAAELARGADACDGHDIDEYQDTYDTATVRAAFERLALAHWRARRLSATALRDTMLGAAAIDNDEDDDPSGMAQMWNLTVHAAIAADAVLAVLARLVTPPSEPTAAAAGRLDAATALLVSAGHSAAGLRAALGMDGAGDTTEEADAIPR